MTKKARKSPPKMGAMGGDGAEWRNRLGQKYIAGAQKNGAQNLKNGGENNVEKRQRIYID